MRVWGQHASTVCCNGHFTYSSDIPSLPAPTRPRVNRRARGIAVAYNSYFGGLFRLAPRVGLRAGEALAIFPEVTTSDGLHRLPVHATSLHSAISPQSPPQPVSMQFVDTLPGPRRLAPVPARPDPRAGAVLPPADPPCRSPGPLAGDPKPARPGPGNPHEAREQLARVDGSLAGQRVLV